ncbi:MAG: hypothetical protein KAG26_07150 [Methylococcales bacterium]|nr:hypothetical protein [Methylococcales bacterium]
MRIGLRILLFCFDAPIIFFSVILLLMIESTPSLPIPYSIEAHEIRAVKAMFRSVHNRPDKIKTLRFTEKNLNNMVNYFLKRYLQVATHLALKNNELGVKISLKLPKNIWGDYLNIRVDLYHRPNQLVQVKQLTIGKIEVADEFSQALLVFMCRYSKVQKVYEAYDKTIKEIVIKPNKLQVKYDFKSLTYTDFLISLLTEDQQSLWFYQQAINRALKAHDKKFRLSLKELLQPLFKIAYQRSTSATAIAENKRVIMVVSRYVSGVEIQRHVPSEITYYPTFLYQRTDIAKHFMTSALLTVIGTGSIATILGQEKEIRDAKIGSGFSFIDLAGDRAGIYFGKMLTQSPESARRLQKLMSEIKDYKAFMPDIRDLPEKLTNEAFTRRFGSTDNPAYQLIVADIDQRIRALPIYVNQDSPNKVLGLSLK